MDDIQTINTSLPSAEYETTEYVYPLEVIPWSNPEEMEKPWIRDAYFIPIVLVYTLCMVIGSVGNVLFMWAMIGDRKSRSATGMFLVSLAVADLLLLLSAPPDVASYFVRSHRGGNVSCKVVGYSRSLSAFSTVLNLMAITVERFYVIVHPMRSRQLVTIRNCKIVLAIVWTLAILMALPSAFTWEVQPFYYGKVDNSSKVIEDSVVSVLFCEEAIGLEDGQIMSIYHLIFLFILPLAVQSALYGVMIHVLWISTTDVYLNSHAGGPSAQRGNISRTPSAATRSTALVPETSHSSACAPMLPSVSTNPDFRKLSGTGSADAVHQQLPQCVAGKQLPPRDLTSHRMGRNRSGSLAFAECPLGRARSQRKNNMVVRCLSFAKRHSDARYKSSSSLAHTNGVDQGPLRPQNLDIKAGRRQVIKMLVVVNLAFIVCYGPAVVFDVLRLHGSLSFGNALYMTKVIVKLLPYAHCCLNPIIYGVMSRNFRAFLRSRQAFACLYGKKADPSADDLRIKSAQIFHGTGDFSSTPLTPTNHRRRLSSSGMARS